MIVVSVGTAVCGTAEDPHSINHPSVISQGAERGVETKLCWYFLLRYFYDIWRASLSIFREVPGEVPQAP